MQWTSDLGAPVVGSSTFQTSSRRPGADAHHPDNGGLRPEEAQEAAELLGGTCHEGDGHSVDTDDVVTCTTQSAPGLDADATADAAGTTAAERAYFLDTGIIPSRDGHILVRNGAELKQFPQRIQEMAIHTPQQYGNLSVVGSRQSELVQLCASTGAIIRRLAVRRV